MSKDTRGKVTLTPEAYKALEIEAMLQGISLKDAASKLIIKAACPKCIEILDIMARPPKRQKAEEPQVIIAQETKGQSAQLPDIPTTKRLRLSQNQAALAKIKTMWKAGEQNTMKIAKEIGYPKATTWENIKKMKDRGEIK